MSSNILVVNSTSLETRVAYIEGGIISEFYLERRRDRGVVGNIYKGRVLRVLPGMQAAFVDIGADKAGFLYVSDVHDGSDASKKGRRTGPIEDRLREGQHVLVQVAKEPMGTKGARITGHVSLPGRYLVYMPTMEHVGISRRIADEAERERLRVIVNDQQTEGTGFIVRTVSEGVDEQHLRGDMNVLRRVWDKVVADYQISSGPTLLHEEPDLALRVTRDLFTTDLERMVVDNEADYRRITDFVESYLPGSSSLVDLYQGSEPIFDAYGIEIELTRGLGRKVWLSSGGYIVIDHTEALTAIDVNTGKYVGRESLEETIVKNNLEAVEEIAYQLRLRSIGGIIIIDFIDMELQSHRDEVYDALVEALKSDRAKTNVLKISEFGLVEMTRKRVRESLVQHLCEECPYCDGKGYVKSGETVAYEIVRQVEREAARLHPKTLTVEAHPDVIAVLETIERGSLDALAERHGHRMILAGREGFHIEQREITSS